MKGAQFPVLNDEGTRAVNEEGKDVRGKCMRTTTAKCHDVDQTNP